MRKDFNGSSNWLVLHNKIPKNIMAKNKSVFMHLMILCVRNLGNTHLGDSSAQMPWTGVILYLPHLLTLRWYLSLFCVAITQYLELDTFLKKIGLFSS
jgi:hypothetical protein